MPSTRALAGSFIDDFPRGIPKPIERAHRIDHADGRVAFLVEFADSEEAWELRLDPARGRELTGRLTFRGYPDPCPVRMEMWRAVDDDDEWLLLGTWTDHAEGETTGWAITLFADDQDD